MHPHPSCRTEPSIYFIQSVSRNYYMTTNTPQVAINDIGSEADLIAV